MAPENGSIKTSLFKHASLVRICGFVLAQFALMFSSSFDGLPLRHDDYHDYLLFRTVARTTITRPVSLFVLCRALSID